jgi:hypothetical protein
MKPNPGEMVDGLPAVRWDGCSRFQNVTAKNVVITFSDTMILFMHSGNDKSHFAPDHERYSCPLAPPRSVCH